MKPKILVIFFRHFLKNLTKYRSYWKQLNLLYNNLCNPLYKSYFNMNDFWTNILRYPRFFISSLVGLILVILTPVRNLFKNPKSRVVVILFSLIFLISLYLILINMVGL